MKAGILSTTISVFSAFAVSASPSNDLLVGEDNTRGLKTKVRSSKVSKKSPKGIKKHSEACKDPLAAVKHTLQCIADGDAVCASMGYDVAAFKKIHNGKDTGLVLGDGVSFWTFALQMSQLSFSFDHEANIGPNMASIRYIEGVQFSDGTVFGLPASDVYPFSTYFVQHEHALVTVDDDCKMTKWDQYGDDTEQNAVDDASFAVIGVLCAAGIFPPEVCVSLGIGPE